MKHKLFSKIALGIEYDGTNMHGWQKQSGLLTVQGCLEKALSRLANHRIKVFCAGRTDRGVHALGQVVHFETQAYRPLKAWVRGTNYHLARTGLNIIGRWAVEVPDNFHARHSATSRRYHYWIDNRAISSAILRHYATSHPSPLNEALMNEAGQYLLGEHDFTAFRSADCTASTPIRRVQTISVKRFGQFVLVDIAANAFLHRMVRRITGALMMVGEGKKAPQWVGELLASKQRGGGYKTANPEGLYLAAVTYPEKFSLPVFAPFPFSQLRAAAKHDVAI